MTTSTLGLSVEVPTVGRLSLKSPVEVNIANLFLALRSWVIMCPAESWLAINSYLMGFGDSSSSNTERPPRSSTISVSGTSRGPHKLLVSICWIGGTIKASGFGDSSESSVASLLPIFDFLCRHLRIAKAMPKTLTKKNTVAERLVPITATWLMCPCTVVEVADVDGGPCTFVGMADVDGGMAIMFSLSASSNLVWETEKLEYS